MDMTAKYEIVGPSKGVGKSNDTFGWAQFFTAFSLEPPVQLQKEQEQRPI